MSPNFDEIDWETAVIDEKAAENWAGYTKYPGELLTYTPIYGKQIVAEMACRRHDGQKMNLISAGKGYGKEDGCYQMFFSELLCEQNTELEILVKNAVPRVTIDGQPYHLGEKCTRSKGSHVLCMSAFCGFELLVNLPDGILSSERFCGEPCLFAGFGFSVF